MSGVFLTGSGEFLSLFSGHSSLSQQKNILGINNRSVHVAQGRRLAILLVED